MKIEIDPCPACETLAENSDASPLATLLISDHCECGAVEASGIGAELVAEINA